MPARQAERGPPEPGTSVAGRRRRAAPADRPLAAGLKGSSEWDPCPSWQRGVARGDRHVCVALVEELFRELDAWEAEHGWLYR